MPLLVSSKEYKDSTVAFERVPQQKGVNKLLHIIYKRYEKHAHEFRTRDRLKVSPPDERLLYVTQREMAVVHADDAIITHIGSDDATTCHIMVLRNADTGFLLLTHLDDSDTPTQVSNALERLTTACGSLSDSESLDCYLVGGYNDERQLSLQVTVDVLHALDIASVQIRLRLACVTQLNTITKSDGSSWPVVYGVAATTGLDDFEIFPARFPDKGPDLGLRSARHFGGKSTLLDIYDPVTHQLRIPPFHYNSIVDAHRLANQSDQWIRQHMSTSPEVEPDDFADSVRRCLTFVSEHPDSQVVFNDLPRVYVMDEGSGSWLPDVPE